MKLIHSAFIATARVSVFLMLASLTSLAQAQVVRARVMRTVDIQDSVILSGNVHPLARPEYDQGVAPDDLSMERILLVLHRGADQEAALRQRLDDQQVKSSPLFHQWLTPVQFGQQFGPADSDLDAVRDWLTTQGFVVKKVSAGRTVIEFSGSAGLVRQALGTEIHRYRVNGKDHWANTSDPRIPAALAPVVAGFASLNNFPRPAMFRKLGTVSRSKLTGKLQPQFTFSVSCLSATSLETCSYYGVGPADFATIYNVQPLWNASPPIDGTGQTIAIVGQTNINLQDVADFRSMFGLPANVPNIILDGPDPGIQGDETEADLDVEWTGAVAKGATIDLVISESTEVTAGIDLSALYIIDNNLAPVMSLSYGGCEAAMGTGSNVFHSTLWEQAAAQGITVVVATGDSGSAGCDYANEGELAAQYGLAVSGTASTPFNVAVGGTDFNVTTSDIPTYWSATNTLPSQSSAKSYIPEIPWNDSCAASGLFTGCQVAGEYPGSTDGLDLLAGSGGRSSCISPSGTFPSVSCGGGYAKPSWQSGAGVPNDSARDIPDVSLLAADGLHYSFYVFCQMDVNSTYGGSSTSCDLNSPYTDFLAGSGTSVSAQAFAGVMALVNQRYGRQGNANYVLYPMAAKTGASCYSNPVNNSSCTFYDITAGNNSVACLGTTPNCSEATFGDWGIMVSGNPASAAYPATAGYDLATGLGSVNVANLVNNWTSSFTPSTTSLTLFTIPATSPITLMHGQPINFTVNVASGSGTPAGDVSFIAQTGNSSSNVTGIGPFTLRGGSISGLTAMLPAGSYNVTAHYAGNGAFAASDSSPGIPVTVGKESSQTQVRLVTLSNYTPPVYNVTTITYGTPYVLRMDVTNGSGQVCANQTTGLVAYPCPTGALTVTPTPAEENPPPGAIPGSYSLNSQGYAEDQPIQMPGGSYIFVATYAGDENYTGSMSAALPVTINKASISAVSTSGIPATTFVGHPITMTVKIETDSMGFPPTGTLQLVDETTHAPYGSPVAVTGTPSSSTAGASAQGALNAILPGGVVYLDAYYSGDGNYLGGYFQAAGLTVVDFGVSASPSAISISAPGMSGSSTITVNSQFGFIGSVSLGIVTGCPAGATCTISPEPVEVTGASAATSTLSITTTAATPGLARRFPPNPRLPFGLLCLFAGSLALVRLFGSSAGWRRPAALWLATVLLMVGMWAACGGGGGGAGSSAPPSTPTPAGTYPIAISAVSGTDSHSLTVNVTVQ